MVNGMNSTMNITDCKSPFAISKARLGRAPTMGEKLPAHLVITEGSHPTIGPVCIITARGDTFAVKDTLKAAGLKFADGSWSAWLRGADEVANRDAILTAASLPMFRLPQ